MTLEENTYKALVEHLVLNNRLRYSEVPYELRIQNLALFYYALRVARDNLCDATQFVEVLQQFLLDIDEIEKEGGVNTRLRVRVIHAIVGVENKFTGVEAFDGFIRQQERTRAWLFED
ncbi:hypothetical protein RyT2_25300 [Pseudolactococcus yaeyamensis]